MLPHTFKPPAMNSLFSSSPQVSANSFCLGFRPSCLDQVSSVMYNSAFNRKHFNAAQGDSNLLAMCHLKNWEQSRCISKVDHRLIYHENQTRSSSCIGVGITEEKIGAFFNFGVIFKTRNTPPQMLAIN